MARHDPHVDPHPMQAIVMVDGVACFRENKIVSFLLDYATAKGVGLNELAMMPGFSSDDWSQFSQLIGYSVSGFGDLSHADPEHVRRADEEVARRRLAEARHGEGLSAPPA